MFRSCEWKYLDYDSKTDQDRYEITIVDDDFIETVATISAASVSAAYAIALIDIYSRRNLNVAGNLVLYMQYAEHRWSELVINLQIEEYSKYVPEYSKYHDQVMGYLVFM